jgi:hypothetical protein
MSRPVLVRVHLAAAAGALAVISAFLVSSVVTELVGSPGDVRVLRHGILLGLPLLIGCLAAAALTSRRMAGRSRVPVVRRKQRRMQVVAALGLVVLVPCAVALDYLAGSAAAGSLASVLEITEILAGGVNLALLALNFRDGRGLTRRRGPARSPRSARHAQVVDTRS